LIIVTNKKSNSCLSKNSNSVNCNSLLHQISGLNNQALAAGKEKPAKNIILLIGDGRGLPRYMPE
jgi:alkaline phosphatase